MARVNYSLAINDSFSRFFDGDLDLSTNTKTAAVWTDTENFHSISFEGTKFKFNGDDIVSGTISKIVLKDAEGLVVTTFRGEYDAAKVYDSIKTDAFEEILFAKADRIIGTDGQDYLTGGKGADKLIGRAGDDTFSGGAGNDRMTGGDGSDVFFFHLGDSQKKEHDVITDFDANGFLIDGQDYLGCDMPSDIHKDGRNTVLEFSDGSTLTLLNVKPSEITSEDFIQL